MRDNAKSKYWCFTLNNYDEEEYNSIKSVIEEQCTYGVIGREVGESGTKHLQGYVELGKRVRFGGIKRLLGQRCHIERRGGTGTQAAAYCKKDDTEAYEFGELAVSKQGKRSDLDTIKELIDGGASERDVADAHFSKWVIYRKSFSAYRQLRTDPGIRRTLDVIVLWGAPGTGKTRYVWDKYPDVFSVPDPELRWFDGYSGEDTVLIDDYRGGASDSFILKLLDIYPLQVPVKGGFVQWAPSRIFLTSNDSPPWTHSAVAQALRRRIRVVLHFSTNVAPDDTHKRLFPDTSPLRGARGESE